MTDLFRRCRSIRWIAGLILVCFFGTDLFLKRVAADEPELTSLIGENVGLCLEIRDLGSQIRDVPSTEWFRRVRDLSLVKRWQQGPEFAKWQAGQAGLAILLGQSLDQFVTELFGESVVIAISPSPTGTPTAVLLSRAAKDDTWDRVLALWDQLEAHDVQTKSAFGRSYQLRRKKTNGQTTGPDLYTVKLGRTLAISEREELILDVIVRATSELKDDRAKPLGQSAAYRRAIAELPERSVLRLFVDPRRWDNDVAKDATSAAWLMPLWHRLQWFSAGVEVREDIVFHAIAHHDTNELPTVWQKFVAASEAPSKLSARLPADSLLAGETRFTPEFFRSLQTLDPSEKSQRDWQTFGKVTRGLLGRDLLDEVLPHARPNIGGAIVAKIPVDEQSTPVDGLLAWPFDLSKEGSGKNDQPALRESLDGALLTLLNFAAVAHNSRNPDSPATLMVRHRESMIVRWLDNLPPFRPAYGLSTGHLLVASDPRLISGFDDRSGAENGLGAEPLFATTRSRHFPDHSQWLFLNARATRQFLEEQREPLSRQVAHWRNIAPPSAAVHLSRVQELLTPFDAAFVAAKVSAGEIRFTAGLVTPDEPR